MHIEFNQTAIHARKNFKQISRQIYAVLESGIFLNGKQNQALEKKLKKILGKGLVTITGSGHDSLVLALKSLKLRSIDEIIFPVNSYPTAFALSEAGAKIVPVDVDVNGQLDPKEVQKKITKYTKVIVTVHLYGLVGDIKKITSIAKKHNLFLIEDAAQSFGTEYDQKPTGTLGDIGCFSFYPTKNLGTLGDGGAIWTKHKRFYDYILQAKSYGEKKRYQSEFVSGHSRMPEIQAGALNHYLTIFNKDKKQRQNIAKLYLKYLKGITNFRPFLSKGESNCAVHLFVAEAYKRDHLRKFLASNKIPTDIHYPKPIHLIPAFSSLQYKKGDFPMAERLSKAILSLPFHQYLKEKDIVYIANKIKEFYND